MRTTINISGELQQLHYEALKYNNEIVMPKQQFDYLSHNLLKYIEVQITCLENTIKDIMSQVNKCKQILELNGEELNSITYLGNIVHLDHKTYESFDELSIAFNKLRDIFESIVNEDPIEVIASMEDDAYWDRKLGYYDTEKHVYIPKSE